MSSARGRRWLPTEALAARPSGYGVPGWYTVTGLGEVGLCGVDGSQTIVLASLPAELLSEAEELLWEAGLTELPKADTSRFIEAEPVPGEGMSAVVYRPKGEIKGDRGEDAKEKKGTMDTYWVPGVNNLGSYGRWAFAEFTDVYAIQSDFEAEVESHFSDMIDNAVATAGDGPASASDA